MANFLNYIVESSIQPVKTNVLWIKNGVPYYFNKKWKPLLGSGSGGGPGESVDSPIQFGEGEYSAVLKNSNSKALNEYALALGYNTVSNNPSETAFGRYNKSIQSNVLSEATLFSIGNGTKDKFNNALEVKYDGSLFLQNLDKSVQENLKVLLENQISFDVNLKEISASISVTEEKLRSEYTQIREDLEGNINDLSSSITQTAEEIRLEVNEVQTNLDGKIEENTSLIQQTADQIRLEVSEEVKTLDGKIEENTSSITQTANSINLRVEGLEGTLDSKTSELEGKITKNTSEIALNKEQIGLKVNTDVFDALAGTVEQQGASIEINTNSIKNKVEQSSFNAFTGEVNNQFTEVNQSIEGITTTVQDNTGKITVIEATVDGLTSKTGTLEAEIESLKKQSDGSIDTHFGTTAPTLNNEPAVNWDTDELKNEHTGDIYYNNTTGEAYRFSYDPQTNTYFWVELTDSALTDALEKISKLEEAIDGKVTIFYTQPSNYKYGDIWFVHNSSYSPYKEGSLLTATNLVKDAVVESFNLNHWVLKADIVKSLNDLDKTVTDAFKDNIITIAEIDAIKESKKSFESSFQELTSAHAIVIATTLGNSTKLKTAYSNLESKYNAFIQSIDSLVLDSNGNLSDVLLQAYTTAYNDYVEALKNYSKAKEELTDSIQKELSSANDYIKDISSDGVITPIEKKNLIEIWRSIAEEFNTNKGIAVNYKIIDSEGNKRTDIYSDGVYYSNYALYEAAFDEIKTIFTSDVFGISNTTTSTTLPEGYSTNTIDNALNNYYDALSVFSEMISKITIEITDAHEKVLQLSKDLQEQLSPSDNITQIGKGVILSSVIGVQSNGVLQAGLNATNINGLVDTSEDNHGRIVFAGGINGATDWNTANTVIYEDGYVHFRWGEIDEGVEIGNALIRSVVSGTIDLFSYPENGTLVPLFIVNKDNTGKIVSISTPYDFIANKNLIVYGDTASGGEGGGGSSSVGIQGIILNGTTYRDDNSDGIIELGTIGGGTLTEITYEMIVEALGYTPVSSASLGSLAYKNGLTASDIPDLSGIYLPKAGGILDGSLQIGKDDNTAYNYLRLVREGYEMYVNCNAYGGYISYGAIGASTAQLRLLSDSITFNGNTLIHSGNIGSQSVDKATRIRTLVGSEVPDINTLSFADWSIRWYSSIPSSSPNLPSYSGYQNGLLVFPLHSVGTTAQMYMTAGNYLGFRGTTSGSWKQIAFTDSNVASADYATSAGYADRLLSPYSYEGGNIIYNDTSAESLFSSSFTFSAMMENCYAFDGYATVLNFTGYKQYGCAQLAVYYNNTTPRMALRNFTQTTWNFTDWRELAFTDSDITGNAGSATKLANKRSIWGQEFDGTDNIGNAHLNIYQHPSGVTSDWVRTVRALNSSGTILSAFGFYGSSETLNYTYIGKSYQSPWMLINSSGNVTIGDVDTAATISGCKLFVGGDTYVGGKFTLKGKSGVSSDYIITNQEANGLHLYVAGNTGTFFAGNGNVGIGTTDPVYKLNVNGDVGISSTNGSIEIDNGRVIGNATLTMQAIGTTHARIQTSHFGVAYTCPLYINPSGGNVLIGTTTDSGYKLDVNGLLKAAAANFGGSAGINIGMTYSNSTSSAYDLIERKHSGGILYFQYNHNGGVNLCNGGGGVDMGGALSVKGAVTMASNLKVDSYIDITGTSRLRGNVTMDGDVHMGNNKGFYFKNSAGSGALSLFLSSSNVLGIAYSNIASVNIGVATTIEGALTVGAGATINGNLVVTGDISA